MVNKILILGVLLIGQSCASAQSLEGYVVEKMTLGISVPDSGSDEYYLKVRDTTVKMVTLVFETQFEDSIIIKVNDSVCIASKIKTSSIFSRVPEPVVVDYKNYNSRPEITLLLVDKRKYIKFRLYEGYRILYLNRFNNEWLVEFSNYGRTYY